MYYNFNLNKFCESNLAKDKLAIVGSDRDINWGDLKLEVEEYKLLFQRLQIPKGHPVIIYGNKEASFLVVLLALINSDIPYIPFDQSYPDEWLLKIKNITGSNVVIKVGEYNLEEEYSIIIESDKTVSRNNSERNYKTYLFPNDILRYIMFTSGSTGEPKCIQITNSSLLSFINWLRIDHPFSKHNIFMNQASFSFDLSGYNIFATISLGATIVLFDTNECNNYNIFYKKLNKYKVSTWISTPSFAYLYIIDPFFCSAQLESIKTFIFIGEILEKKLISKIWESFRNVIIINSYGPTETTIATMFINCSSNMLNDSNDIPIGIEKYNGKIVLFDSSKIVSNKGEITIIGDQVSKGYLNASLLDKENFFTWQGKKAYRSGDYGYINKGYLYFSGRKDSQIKLNGFRIELNEINKVIFSLEFVDSAITIPLKKGNKVKKIISIIIVNPTFLEPPNVVRELVICKIENYLPNYMLPADIKCIDHFPLNQNNKICKETLVKMYMNNDLI